MTAASMVKERQLLETGIQTHLTILVESSTVLDYLDFLQTLSNGMTVSAMTNDLSCAILVSFLVGEIEKLIIF